MTRSAGYGVAVGFLFFGLSTEKIWGQIGDSLENQSKRMAIAEAWAPTLFHDSAVEFVQTETGFNPVDSLVSVFYDGNEDLRDNGENLFRLSVARSEELKNSTPVYFSVIESESHYYINYIFYHAIDAGAEGHVHDTENLLTIVQKDNSVYGRLTMTISNAHGFGMIYGPSAEMADRWRSQIPFESSRNFLPYLDRYSKDHNQGTIEFIQRPHSQSFKAFIVSKTHAVYKFSTDAWSQMAGKNGVIYFPRSCVECADDILKYRDSARAYSLVDWDVLFQNKMNEANLGKRDEFFKMFSSLETEPLRRFNYKARALPSYLAAGFEEEQPRANLFYRSSFHTGIDIVDPAVIHRYLDPNDVLISQRYLFNPYVDSLRTKDSRLTQWFRPIRNISLFRLVGDLWR